MTSKTLLAIPFILVLAACSKSPEKSAEASAPKSEAIQVSMATAESRHLEKSILVTGALAADESVTISPEISGRVTSIPTDFGRAVRKGEVVAELDKTEYQIAVDRTRAALSQALARLGMKPGDTTPPTSTASIRQAQANLEDAKFKYESAAKLVKTGDVSQERFNELEKAYHARQAGVDSMGDDMRTIWMNVESLRAELKLAEKRLGDTVLRAPFDGSISQKHVSVGQYVKDNTAILTLVKTSPLRLRLEVPESAAATVRPGTQVVFSTDAIPGSELQATVRELNPSLDARNRTLTAEARLTNADGRLRPGMFVQVRLITDRAGEVVMVPKKAVYSIAGLTKAFVIKDGKAKERKFAPGRELDGWMEVPGDMIRPGDQVATSNVAMLSEGVEVKAGK